MIALDLRQPDLFKTVQIGDAQCDAEEVRRTRDEQTDDRQGVCKPEWKSLATLLTDTTDTSL